MTDFQAIPSDFITQVDGWPGVTVWQDTGRTQAIGIDREARQLHRHSSHQ